MNYLKILALSFASAFAIISCSKDEPTTVVQNAPPITFAPFGYFQGFIEFIPYTIDDKFPSIILLEKEDKLLLGFNTATLNQSTNLLKGTYSVTGNTINGSYINPNIIPATTYNFTATFDPANAKFIGTLGVSPSNNNVGKLSFERKN